MADLNISLIQAKLFWEDKAANLTQFEEKIAALPAEAELVLLPELFTTGFTMNTALAEEMDGDTVIWMKSMSQRYKIVLVGSIIIQEKGQYFNRLLCVMPNGQIGYYDKRHLFAYARENEHFTAGDKRLIASIKGWRINLQICYDLRFPVWARQSPSTEKSDLPEYDLLVYVANWPERRSHAWKTLLCARAIENQCFVAGVNRVGTDGNAIQYSGDSIIIDPLGELLYHHKIEEDSCTLTLERKHLEDCRQKFPFLQDADDFKLLD